SIFTVVVVGLLQLPVAHLSGVGVFSRVSLAWHGYLANLLLVQDLAHVDSVVAPLWSLPYEMRMYLFLPALYWLVRTFRSPALILIVWAFSTQVDAHSHTFESYGFSNWLIFVPCFLAGVVAYQLLSLPCLELPAWLWPITLGLLTLFYL